MRWHSSEHLSFLFFSFLFFSFLFFSFLFFSFLFFSFLFFSFLFFSFLFFSFLFFSFLFFSFLFFSFLFFSFLFFSFLFFSFLFFSCMWLLQPTSQLFVVSCGGGICGVGRKSDSYLFYVMLALTHIQMKTNIIVTTCFLRYTKYDHISDSTRFQYFTLA